MMKKSNFKRGLIWAFFLLIINNISAQNWKSITSNTSNNLNEVVFIDNLNGFAVGDKGTILKTSDAGETWSSITSNTSEDLMDICINGSNLLSIATKNGKCLISTNKGSSWSLKTISNKNINCIDFYNSTTGIAAGDNGHIYTTSDGGNNWNDLGSFSVYAFNDIKYINDTLVLAVGSGGIVYKSADKGATFKALNANTISSLYSVSGELNNYVTIVGTSGALIRYKISGGDSFDDAVINDQDWIQSTSNHKLLTYVAGYNNTFWVNQNGTWTNIDTDIPIQITSFDLPNDSTIIAVGLQGKIVKTTNRSGFNPIGINELEIKPLSIYPNPVLNQLSIKLNVNLTPSAILDIYNSTGSLVRSIQNLNSLIVHTSDLSEGVYFIKIKDKHTIYSSKFIKR